MKFFIQIVLGTVCLIATIEVKSQAYKPLIGVQGNHWYHTSCVGQACLLEYYYAVEDTIMDGKVYRFLDSFHYNKVLQIREDTAARQVFLRSNTVTKDLMIYDFSATVGGTMEMFNPNSPLPHNSGYYTLDSIVPRVIMGGTHRFFYWSENNGSGTTTWIEGMGSMALINTPASEADLYGVGEATCYFRDGVYVFEADTLPQGPCDTTIMVTSLPDLTIEESGISVYPNPSNGFIRIYDRNNIGNTLYTILDLKGRIMLSGDLINDQRIDLGDLSAGVYFIHVTSENHVHTRKLIIR